MACSPCFRRRVRMEWLCCHALAFAARTSAAHGVSVAVAAVAVLQGKPKHLVPDSGEIDAKVVEKVGLDANLVNWGCLQASRLSAARSVRINQTLELPLAAV